MVNLKVFCPFERVAQVVRAALVNASVSWTHFKMMMDGMEFVCDKHDDQNLSGQLAKYGDIISLRMHALSRDFEETLSVVVYDDTREVLALSGQVVNCLYTDYLPVRADKGNNGVSGSGPLKYEESVVTTYRTENGKRSDTGIDFKFAADFGERYEGYGRPYYGYVMASRTESSILIFGPGVSKDLFELGVIGVNDKNFKVYTTEKMAKVKPASDPRTESGVEEAVTIILETPNGHFKQYLGQTFQTIEGHHLNGKALLQIFKIAAYEERFGDGNLGLKQGDEVVIPLTLTPSGWRLEYSVESKVDTFVESNATIVELFEKMSATNDALLIRDAKGELGFFSYTKSKACFAFSLAFILMNMCEVSFTAFFSALNCLVDLESLTAEKGEGGLRYLTGNWPVNTVNDVRIDGITGVVTGKIKRMQIAKLDQVVDGGMYLLGYDFDTKNYQVGAPDHYIVVEANNGRIYEYMDPWDGSRGQFRRDVTSLFGSRDSVMYAFAQEM